MEWRGWNGECETRCVPRFRNDCISNGDIRFVEGGKIVLPSSLIMVEAYAFSNVNAVSVVFPSGIEFIDESAFSGSNVNLLIGGNDYVREFAEVHGFTYQEE